MLGEPGFGERTYWIRQGFEQLNKRTAGSSLVQYNPIREEVLMDHLYSARQAAIGDVGCGSDFGGDPQQCKGVLPAFVAVFNQPETIQSWDLDRFCDAFGLNVLVSTDTDPVWRDSESWVWSRPTLIANPAMRAFACGTASPAENRQPR
jgi:hypothetical protein